MTVLLTKPEIVRFEYHADVTDKDRGSCLWTFFDVDAERGTITIQGDRGHFAYTWPEKGEKFWNLCCHMDGDYLMRKMTLGTNKKGDRKLEQIWNDCVQAMIRNYVQGGMA